ncbi:MAG: acyl-CoA dehydrogenase family protein [Pseudomonadota bacterium]
MRRLLTPREQRFHDLAAELADEFAQRADQHDRENSFPFENFEKLQSSGYLKITVPEELGGMGASLTELTVAQERLAQGCCSTALAVNMHTSPVGQLASLWRSSRDARLERWLRDVADGRVISASLSAEPGAPLLRHSTCTLTKVPGGYLLNGKKIFCTMSSVMTHFTTMAQFEDPAQGPVVHFFRLPKDAPGIRIIQTWDTLGVRATQSNDMALENVFVPEDAVFHTFPAYTLDGKMLQSVWGWAQPTFAATYLGMAIGGMNAVRAYVLRMKKQNDPHIQQAFAEMEALAETAHALVYRVSEEMASGRILSELEVQEGMARVVLAKYVASQNVTEIMNKAMVVAGGWGYSNRSPMPRYFRDARAATAQPYNLFDAADMIGKTALGVEVLPAVPIAGVTPDRQSFAKAA